MGLIVRPVSRNTLSVTFSRKVSKSDLDPDQYVFNGGIIPLGVMRISDTEVHVVTTDQIPDRKYGVRVVGQDG